MALVREEREELANLYVTFFRGGSAWNPTPEAVKQGQEDLHTALWAAMCHTTGRCGLAVDQAFPDTPQARLYQLMKKALLDE